jgi:hypothetical protein
MKEIEAFHSALSKASKDASRFMTAQLRNETRANDWPEHVTNSTNVKYGKNGFEAHVHDAHLDEAKNHEYGVPGKAPTAAIRRFSNRTEEAQKFLVGRLSKHLGEL